MKTNRVLFATAFFLTLGCSSPKYLPKSNMIDVNPHGSHIKLKHKTGDSVNGELIAISSNEIVVLTGSVEKENIRCVSSPLTEVESFTLTYAKSKQYGWSIPVFTSFTLTHGVFLIFTAPINFFTSILVTGSANSAFRYTHKNMTYDQLKMFARFPQGIPPGVELASIE